MEKAPPSFSAKTLAEELRKLGLHPIEEFPVDDMHIDIAFPEDWVAVEVDGPCHDNPQQKEADERRDKRLHFNGWSVLRVSADNARMDTEKVAPAIVKFIQKNTLRVLKAPKAPETNYRHFSKDIPAKEEHKQPLKPEIPIVPIETSKEEKTESQKEEAPQLVRDLDSYSWYSSSYHYDYTKRPKRKNIRTKKVEEPRQKKQKPIIKTPKTIGDTKTEQTQQKEQHPVYDRPKILPLIEPSPSYSYKNHVARKGRRYLEMTWILMVISALIVAILYFFA